MVFSALHPTPPARALRPGLHTAASGTTVEYHSTPHRLTNNNRATEGVMEKLQARVTRAKISHLCGPMRGTINKHKTKIKLVTFLNTAD